MRSSQSWSVFLFFFSILILAACSNETNPGDITRPDPSPLIAQMQESETKEPAAQAETTPEPYLLGGNLYTGEEAELTVILTEEDFPLLEKFDRLTRIDLTGSTCYDQISLYRTAHPEIEVIYTVSIDEKTIPWDVRHLSLIRAGQEELDVLPHLPCLESLSIEEPLLPQDAAALIAVLPDMDLQYRVALCGMEVDCKAAFLDLSTIGEEQIAEAVEAMQCFPFLTKVELDKTDGSSPWNLDQAMALIQIRPDIEVHYTTTLFGVTFSLTDEIVSFNKIDLSNEVDTLWHILPALSHVGRLDMENCGIPDEQMAALREAFPSPKIVWRINVHGYTCRTDSIMIRFSDNTMGRRIYDEYTKPFIYCNEVRYLDLGHNAFTDAYFTAYMPDLEVCILAVGEITDISALKNCPKLEYLEIFTGNVTDISVLASCKNLKHLNMCRNEITDISPLFELNLERLYLSKNPIPKDQISEFQSRFPDCEVNDVVDNPTAGAWRVETNSSRYTILRKQLSYDYPGISSYSEVPSILKWW